MAGAYPLVVSLSFPVIVIRMLGDKGLHLTNIISHG